MASGTPAVCDAVDGLAPLPIPTGRIETALLLAPGTPAVDAVDAVDGLAPLAVTFGRLEAPLLLAARPSTLHL